jgi:pimeloyl-ACP methyl ester carboxylesterase
MLSKRLGLILVLVLWSKSLSVISDQPLTNKACHVDGLSDRLQCGYVSVLENPDEPSGPMIDIHYVVIPAIKPTNPAEAFLAISGGPGQSAIDDAAAFVSTFKKVRETRDILLIDQRGTGRSNLLACPEDKSLLPLTIDDRSIDYLKETQKCLSELDGNVAMYDSTTAISDFEAVRNFLGYEKLHIYGISYGSRMAQLYMRYYSGAIKTVTLDGVVPMQQSVLAIGLAIDRGLNLVFDQCKEDNFCNKEFPDLETTFHDLTRQITAAPLRAPIYHPSTGASESFLLTRDKLFGIIRLSMYSPSTRSILPLAITETANGNYKPLLGLFSLMMDGIDLAAGMHNSVVCSEDIHRVTPEMLVRIKQSYIATTMYEAMSDACSVWPSNKVDEKFSSPISSNIPTLLLSGYFDPATPPDWGAMAMTKMTNAKHFIAPYSSHGVAYQTCGNDLVAKLIEVGDVNGLDDSCLNEQGPIGFFLNASTAQPLSSNSSTKVSP